MVEMTDASDGDIRENVDAFKAALHARQQTLPTVTIGRILLAVDRSNQGETAERFAVLLARAHSATVILIYAYEGAREEARERYLTRRAQALADAGVSLEPQEEPVRSEHGLRSFEQILAAGDSRRCDLIVVPAPYLDDYEKLGEASVGANLDILMSRAAVPLLVVRDPKADPAECLENALFPITPYTPAAVVAAAWTLKMVANHGSIRLLALIESARLGEVEDADQDLDQVEIDAEKLAGLYRPELAGLVAVMQRKVAAMRLKCRLTVRGGEPMQTITELANEDDALLVLASSSDPQSIAQMRAAALVRASRNPVLLVP